MNNIKTGLPYNLTKIIISPQIYLILRVVLGMIFIYSGSVKLMDHYTFADIINAYGILPFFLVYPAAIVIPIIEIIAGAGLVLNLKYSLELITVMLLFFICILLFGILTDLKIDCGCFSGDDIGEEGNLREALYRDFIFIAISGFLFISRWLNNTNRPKSIINLFQIRKMCKH